MARLERFEDIDAWKMARELTKDVYQITGTGQFARDFGLRDQIRRAVVSIMSNIAEALSEVVKIEPFYNFYLSQRTCGKFVATTL